MPLPPEEPLALPSEEESQDSWAGLPELKANERLERMRSPGTTDEKGNPISFWKICVAVIVVGAIIIFRLIVRMS